MDDDDDDDEEEDSPVVPDWLDADCFIRFNRQSPFPLSFRFRELASSAVALVEVAVVTLVGSAAVAVEAEVASAVSTLVSADVAYEERNGCLAAQRWQIIS